MNDRTCFNHLSVRSQCLSAHYKSTGDLSDPPSAGNSVPTSPNLCFQFHCQKKSDAFVIGTPPRPGDFCCSNLSPTRSNRRSTITLEFSKQDDCAFDRGKMSGSLGDVQQFHASSRSNFQQESIEEEEEEINNSLHSSVMCRQEGPPIMCMRSTFSLMSSSSSLESPPEEPKHPIVERKHDAALPLSNQKIPNFKFQPASPNVERATLKWASSTSSESSKPRRKISDATRLSIEDENTHPDGHRRSLSKSPTRVPVDQILLGRLKASIQTSNSDLFSKWPSVRKKKSKSFKKDESQERSCRTKTLSNTFLFDSSEQQEGWG